MKREPEPNLVEMARAGFYWCSGCMRVTERKEREQGLTAICSRCGSVRIRWIPPVLQEQTATSH